MDITDWQLWLDLFSTSEKRPGVFATFMWSTYEFVRFTPLLLGAVVLALTFVRPRGWVRLPVESTRRTLLARFGTLAPLCLIMVATICGVLVALFRGFTWSGYVNGAWFRAAVPLTLVALLGVTLLRLRREPQPTVGERAILPRRPWHGFSPRSLIAIIGVTITLYLATELWQAAVGPEPRELHNAVGGDRVLKNVGGAPPTALGWENHAASLLGILLVVVMLLWLLKYDASRPVPSHAPLAEVASERKMTARLVCQITLGGTLLALGVVWLHTWAPTTEYVEIREGRSGHSGDMIISHFHGLVGVLRAMGWVFQGLGAGLLLRLLVDTVRSARAARTTHDSTSPRADATSQRIGAEQ